MQRSIAPSTGNYVRVAGDYVRVTVSTPPARQVTPLVSTNVAPVATLKTSIPTTLIGGVESAIGAVVGPSWAGAIGSGLAQIFGVDHLENPLISPYVPAATAAATPDSTNSKIAGLIPTSWVLPGLALFAVVVFFMPGGKK